MESARKGVGGYRAGGDKTWMPHGRSGNGGATVSPEAALTLSWRFVRYSLAGRQSDVFSWGLILLPGTSGPAMLLHNSRSLQVLGTGREQRQNQIVRTPSKHGTFERLHGRARPSEDQPYYG